MCAKKYMLIISIVRFAAISIFVFVSISFLVQARKYKLKKNELCVAIIAIVMIICSDHT